MTHMEYRYIRFGAIWPEQAGKKAICPVSLTVRYVKQSSGKDRDRETRLIGWVDPESRYCRRYITWQSIP